MAQTSFDTIKEALRRRGLETPNTVEGSQLSGEAPLNETMADMSTSPTETPVSATQEAQGTPNVQGIEESAEESAVQALSQFLRKRLGKQ